MTPILVPYEIKISPIGLSKLFLVFSFVGVTVVHWDIFPLKRSINDLNNPLRHLNTLLTHLFQFLQISPSRSEAICCSSSSIRDHLSQWTWILVIVDHPSAIMIQSWRFMWKIALCLPLGMLMWWIGSESMIHRSGISNGGLLIAVRLLLVS